MIEYNLIKLLLLHHLSTTYKTNHAFRDYINEFYDSKKINDTYIDLLENFLNEYALSNTEKSE